MSLVQLMRNLVLSETKKLSVNALTSRNSVRHKVCKTFIKMELPTPGRTGRHFRRKVHYPEEYTTEPVPYTKLGGRDPETGRKIVEGIGGGIKFNYHWVQFGRDGPVEGPPKEEKVMKVIESGCRTSHVALVASGDELKYILATENMKEGDIIKTSKKLPRIPVRAKEGDCYPLGALPLGTVVNSVQMREGSNKTTIRSAGSSATIKRHLDGKVVLQFPNKREFAISPRCRATVGRLSNVLHSETPIGSATRSRELGNRPRSGLWQRKTGRFGRKIRPIPPLKNVSKKSVQPPEILRFTCSKYRVYVPPPVKKRPDDLYYIQKYY